MNLIVKQSNYFLYNKKYLKAKINSFTGKTNANFNNN